ncbi:MAG: PhoH family protein, partial [Gammaproteobacteria bacterium]|nr:PhoH family protein [Gammaproteobacteria bacterium]
MHTVSFKLTPENNDRLNNLCGQVDENLHLIERHLAVEINHRGFQFKLIGPEDAVKTAEVFLKDLYDEASKGPIKTHELNLSLRCTANQENCKELAEDVIIRTSKASIKPLGANQLRYLKRIASHDINFGIGPAGTGKTHLAVATAVQALENEKVARLVLVRPAVEAGESLGFLPGDLAQKVDPYLRPMYDALYEMMGAEKVLKLIERQIIEVAPLAFMRGRTLNDAFVILDESQNTTADQMKMFLTRIGFNTTAVITGDITQVDLPRGKQSGLRHAIQVLDKVDG